MGSWSGRTNPAFCNLFPKTILCFPHNKWSHERCQAGFILGGKKLPQIYLWTALRALIQPLSALNRNFFCKVKRIERTQVVSVQHALKGVQTGVLSHGLFDGDLFFLRFLKHESGHPSQKQKAHLKG